MFRSISFIILIVCGSFMMMATAYSGGSSAVFVKALEKETRVFLRSGNYYDANALFAKKFQMEIFAKRCLEDHWAELNSQERERYARLLSDNIQKRMREKMFFTKEDSDFRMTTQKVSKTGDGLTKIDSKIHVKNGIFNLAIYLVRVGEDMKVVDYDIEGALLSRNYRGQFNHIFRKHGKSGLFAKLEGRLSSQ